MSASQKKRSLIITYIGKWNEFCAEEQNTNIRSIAYIEERKKKKLVVIKYSSFDME